MARTGRSTCLLRRELCQNRDKANPPSLVTNQKIEKSADCGAPGRFELPPLPPEGERRPWNGATLWQLPRNSSLFGSSWIASNRIVFREVLPFCCHGSFLGRAFALPELAMRWLTKCGSRLARARRPAEGWSTEPDTSSDVKQSAHRRSPESSSSRRARYADDSQPAISRPSP